MQELWYKKVTWIIITLFLLVACGTAENQNDLLGFVATPDSVGAPQFLQPTTAVNDSAYPAPGETTDSGYPVPNTANDQSAADNGYPAAVSAYSSDGRSQTALASYDLAVAVAVADFDSSAYLAVIAPSHIMLRNLGNPPVLPGWFFIFYKPESKREFIVQIVDDIVTGSTLTESASDLARRELPIDVAQLKVDSPQVLSQFEEIGKERGLWSDSFAYDLELVNLQGSNGPTWIVVDPTTFERLYAIDAITGQEVPDPYQ